MGKIIYIENDTCIRCGDCMELCTGSVFTQENGNILANHINNCWECGHCVAVCPVDAVHHNKFPIEQSPKIDFAKLPSLTNMIASFRDRRSTRVFKKQLIPRELIEQLIDISRWSPSATNSQSVDWICIDDPKQIKELASGTVESLAATANMLCNPIIRVGLNFLYSKETIQEAIHSQKDLKNIVEHFKSGKDLIFFNAPALLIPHVPKGDYFSKENVTYSLYNIMLTAKRKGLGCCQIGYFTVALDRSKKLQKMIGLPQGRKTETALVIGYPKQTFRRLIERRKPDIKWNTIFNKD